MSKNTKETHKPRYNGDRASRPKPPPPAGTERVKETGGLILVTTPSNYLAWKDSMQKVLYASPFDSQGRIIEFGRHPDFIADVGDAPDPSEYDGNRAGLKIAEALHLEELKSATQQKTRYKHTYPAVYQVILNHLDQGCINTLESSTGYSAINESKDPLKLYKLIEEKLSGGSTKQVRETTHEEALSRYVGVRQAHHESLAEFAKRFKQEVLYLKTIGLEAIAGDEGMQTGTFVKRLDPTTFSGFDDRLLGDALKEGGVAKYPKTVDEAVRLASHHEQSRARSSRTPIAASVYPVEAKPRAKKSQKSRAASPPQEPGAEDQPPRSKRDYPCCICKQLGHPAHRCPLVDIASKAALGSMEGAGGGAARAYALDCAACGMDNEECDCPGPVPDTRRARNFTTHSRVLFEAPVDCLTPWHVLFDGQAGEGIFGNGDLLTSIRPASAPCEFSGVGGTLTADMVGDFGAFGVVYYHPSATVNIISWAKAESRAGARVQYDTTSSNTLFVEVGGKKHRFERLDNGLHGKVFKQARVFPLLTTQETEGAKAALKFMDVLGAPSAADVIGLINTGARLDFTAKDVVNSVSVFGPHLPSIKGKSREPPPIAVEAGRILRQLSTHLQMYADIMFIYGCPYLLSIVKPTGLLQASRLTEGRGKTSLRSALSAHFAECRAKGFDVKALHFDGEKSIGAIREFVMSDLRADPVELAGVHVGMVEVQIRTIKNWVRGIAHSLPFTLARPLYQFLVYFCITRLNRLASKRGYPNIPAYEAHEGRKVNVARDFRIGFGAYAQVVAPNRVQKNLVEVPRTDGAIALQPTRGGAVIFLKLKTMRTVVRTAWTELSIPSDVVRIMNEFAAQSTSDPDPPEDEEDQLDDGLQLAESEAAIRTIATVPTLDKSVPVDSSSEDEDEDRSEDTPRDFLEAHAQAEFPLPIDQAESPSPIDVDPSHSDVMAPEPEEPEPIMTDLNLGAPRYELRRKVLDFAKLADVRTRRKVHVHKLTVRQAIRDMPLPAINALLKEIQGFVDIQAFHPVDVSKLTLKQKRSIIRSSIFLKEKFLADGTFDKLRARVVAGGDMQEQMPFEDHSSPTAALASLLLIAALAAREKRFVATMDIGMAYLNAEMPEDVEVLMTLDPVATALYLRILPQHMHLRRADGSVVVKLKKALYGCIQSAKLWYDKLRSVLESDGFAVNPIDPCVFNKGRGADQVTVVVYVDDLMVTSRVQSHLDSVITALKSAFKSVTVKQGHVHSYLGMEFDFGSPGRVSVKMSGYTKDVIAFANVSSNSRTPAGESLFVIDDRSPLLSKGDAEHFHSLVAKLLYLAKRTRPDILCSVSFMSTRVKSPTAQDMKKLLRIVKYLHQCPDLGIVLQVGDEIRVIAYIDASYGVHQDARSHSGVMITLGRGPVFAKSARQKIVTKSSHEAELVAASDGGSQVLWARSFLVHQGYNPKPAVIMQDNMATISSLNKGWTGSEKSRHVNIRYYWIKDRIDHGELEIAYACTDDMTADILTKPLQGDKFIQMRDKLLNWIV